MASRMTELIQRCRWQEHRHCYRPTV